MPGGGKFYGREKWNPRRIVTQILVMQVRAALACEFKLPSANFDWRAQ